MCVVVVPSIILGLIDCCWPLPESVIRDNNSIAHHHTSFLRELKKHPGRCVRGQAHISSELSVCCGLSHASCFSGLMTL